MKHPPNTKKNVENLILVITLLLVFNIATNTPSDFDMWWHLRAGNEMWDQGKILLQDTFSYTRNGAPWVNAFWISDLGMYGIVKFGGFFALTVIVSLVAVAVMVILLLRLEGPIYLRAPLILIAMFAAGINWSPRPQIMSFLLLAGLDYFLYHHHHVKRGQLWILIPLFAIWGNLHGGFIWGILALIATIVGDLFDHALNNQPVLSLKETGQLTLWSMAAGSAVLINPNGLAIWKLPFYQVHVSLTSITEWLSPDFHDFYTHPVLWLLFLLIIGLGFSKKRPSFAELFKGIGFTYMLFVAQRNIAPYVIIITPIAGRQLASALEIFKESPLVQKLKTIKFFSQDTSKPLPGRTNFTLNIFIVSILTVFFLLNAYIFALPAKINAKVPVKAVEWIKENHPDGQIFNSYNWGGYLIWELRDYPVFIDGRADLYGDEILSEWGEIINGTGKGLALLDKYKINLVFLEPKYALLEKLSEHGWKKAFSDSQITIYLRQPPMP